MSPAAELHAALVATRDALDAGTLTRLRASRLVARHCRAALRRHPFDRELGLAVDHMANRGFVPPRPAMLPEGDHHALVLVLSGWTQEEIADLCQSQVTWPDPEDETHEALRTLSLFLSNAAEYQRASALLDALEAHVSPPIAAWARFRLKANQLSESERSTPEQWRELLEPLRALGGEGESELGLGLSIAASALIDDATSHGAEWLQPVLGGQLILNMNLALKRRPALRDELEPAISWAEESRRYEPLGHSHLRDVLEGLEEADAQGDFEAGSAQLDAALSMAAERQDLASALAARAAALGDRVLAARASVLGAEVPHFSPRRSSASVEIAPISAPSVDWRRALEALGSAETLPKTPSELLFLEHAGSRSRAATGWLALGDAQALLQAARLADALSREDRDALTAKVRELLPDDELALEADEEALAIALFSRLSHSEEHTLWALRLGAISPEVGEGDNAPISSTLPGDEDTDPHSFTNRLAAAEDLFEAGNIEAASAILAALLRHDEASAHQHKLIAMVIQALRVNEPTPTMVSAAARAALSEAAPGPVMLGALVKDAMAAYALHDVLHQGALDRRRHEAQRVRLLEAWLGIWAATSTAPEASALHDLMHIDPILLPLAASRLAGWPDPVAEAVTFMAQHPPLETTSGDYGRALLDHMLSAPSSRG